MTIAKRLITSFSLVIFILIAFAALTTDRKFNRMRPSMTGILGDLTPLKSAA